MKTILVVIGFGIVGAIIGSIVEHGFGEGRDNWKRHIAYVLVGFAIATTVVDTTLLARRVEEFGDRLSEIDRYIRGASDYDAAAREIESSPSPLVRSVFRGRIATINNDLQSITRARAIRVGHEEILNTWRDLVGGARKCVWATNLVSATDWQKVARDSGLAVQKAARKRSVKITRVNLFDEAVAGHQQGLQDLRKQQEHIGVHVHELPATWVLTNPTYRRYLDVLGTADVVIVDGEIVLLTHVDPKSDAIINATVTYNREQVEVAKQYFQRLLQEAGASEELGCE